MREDRGVGAGTGDEYGLLPPGSNEDERGREGDRQQNESDDAELGSRLQVEAVCVPHILVALPMLQPVLREGARARADQAMSGEVGARRVP